MDAPPEVECETCDGTGCIDNGPKLYNEPCLCGGGPGPYGERPCHCCGGSGIVSGEMDPREPCPDPDCTSGRRPLRAGDRVTLVQGEWPEHLSEYGPWTAHTDTYVRRKELRRLGAVKHGELVKDRVRKGFAIPLPAPGTVVGEAVVADVRRIYSPDLADDGGLAYEWEPHVIASERAVWTCDRAEGCNEWRNELITGHSHVDWSPGRWAVRLREARAL